VSLKRDVFKGILLRLGYEKIPLSIDTFYRGDYQACRFRGYPTVIRTDQCPEFTGRALDQWAHDHGVALQLTQPGKPTQNAYIESFNGKFRDECLNENWFMTIVHAKTVIAIWRTDYNECRPHGSLAKQTPTEFATRLRLTGDISPLSTASARLSTSGITKT
jgi:putative transposase